MTKTFFIRPYLGKGIPPGELEIGWVFTDETGSTELPFGTIGFGKGKEDQDARLEKYISNLRKHQQLLGNISDFEIDDRRL